MVREAFIDGGVAYHHHASLPGQPLDGADVIPLGRLAAVDLNRYDLVVVPRSADGDALRARRHQFARFLDRGGVLVAFGELWADWFPGCAWREECAEDILAPVIATGHPLVDGFTPADLHWHPARERWCCHGHLDAPAGAEVLVRNQRGDAWLYVDRLTTNGVIVASTNIDPDTHAFHNNATARRFFDQLLAWARAEAAETAARRAMAPPKIAGLYSGVHFQRRFYADPEFADAFAVLPVWELAATDLSAYAALWIPRESNQTVLVERRDTLVRYLKAGGTVVCFDEANRAWLPSGAWAQRPVNLDTLRLAVHPLVAGLTVADARWHSHGALTPPPGAETLIDDGAGGVLLFLDDRTWAGRFLAGTLDPDCHAGFGAEITRPLLRRLVAWALAPAPAPVNV